VGLQSEVSYLASQMMRKPSRNEFTGAYRIIHHIRWLYQNMRQVSVGHCLMEKRIASLAYFYCLLPVKQPVKRQERDDGNVGAGDGTRTRDSLLGRQVVTKTPLAWHKQPSQAD
jgi:hypothetical protein